LAKRRISNREMRDIAENRMSVLLSMARTEGMSGNMERSKRYFQLARAVGMRTNTALPEGTLYCRKCSSLLFPGRNCRVRLRQGKIIYHCLDCDEIRRRPYDRVKGETNGEETDKEGAEGQRQRA
jgi:ribonuclease P protein subunit RPR2